MTSSVIVGTGVNGPWVEITRAIRNRSDSTVVDAAVSYIGANATKLLPLRKGDRLVCDASEAAVHRGLTDPVPLQQFVRRGVSVVSFPGLHAKVVVLRASAWIGSANASVSSSSRLVEAAVRVTDSAAVVQARGAVRDLNGFELGAADLRRLVLLKPEREFLWPGEHATIVLTPTTGNLFLVELEDSSEEAERHARAQSGEAEARATNPRRMRWIEWVDLPRPGVGDWVVDLWARSARRPQLVRHVSRMNKTTCIVWTEEPGDGKQSVRRADALQAIGRATSAQSVDTEQRFTNRADIRALFALFAAD